MSDPLVLTCHFFSTLIPKLSDHTFSFLPGHVKSQRSSSLCSSSPNGVLLRRTPLTVSMSVFILSLHCSIKRLFVICCTFHWSTFLPNIMATWYYFFIGTSSAIIINKIILPELHLSVLKNLCTTNDLSNSSSTCAKGEG